MECMFTMMNNARLMSGCRVSRSPSAPTSRRWTTQGTNAGRAGGRDGAAPIVWHPDVRRMLLLMRSRTEAARALCLFTATSLDLATAFTDAADRKRRAGTRGVAGADGEGVVNRLGVEIASLAVQVHGGMGFIEETGVAQHYRDARITPIYEGTNGIQALDLLGRKLVRDQGAAAYALIGEMRDLPAGPPTLSSSIDAVEKATTYLLEAWGSDPARTMAGATPYLTLFATVVGGWLMAKAALAASEKLRRNEGDPRFLEGKLLSAQFYADHVLPQAAGLLASVLNARSITTFDPDLL